MEARPKNKANPKAINTDNKKTLLLKSLLLVISFLLSLWVLTVPSVRRRNDSDVDLYVIRAPKALKLTALQYWKQLGLEFQRQGVAPLNYLVSFD